MNQQPSTPLLWRNGEPVPRTAVLAAAASLAAGLRDSKGPVINLCEDRGYFLIAFLAALAADRQTVLPPSSAPEAVRECTTGFEDAVLIDDARVVETAHPPAEGATVEPPADHTLAVTLFTSGSTGSRRGHPRHWDHLRRGAALLRLALDLPPDRPHHLVATVPPQHTFGLETSILLPLLENQAVDAGRPFFPDDIRRALAQLPEPRILITTPLHLRACLQSELDWPRVARVVSATAPLDPLLAERTEAVLGGTLREIYGSTETGALAVRETARDAVWQPLPGVELLATEGGWSARGEHFPESALADQLRRDGAGGFHLVGRDRDLIKIAGKRASLAALNEALLALPGVEDGVMVSPDTTLEAGRLAALVVAPDRSIAELRQALARRLDPAFLPRPLVKVAGLPRDGTGKLPRSDLEALLRETGVRR